MVASGVASKGLDFNDIQHVIIYSMPKEIEDYVHQIGRTGRSGKTGIATTFVNMNTPEQTLLDLKYLLMEAGQKFVVALFSNQFGLLMRSMPEFHHFCRLLKIPGLRKVVPSRAVLFAEVYYSCPQHIYRTNGEFFQALDMEFQIVPNWRTRNEDKWHLIVPQAMAGDINLLYTILKLLRVLPVEGRCQSILKFVFSNYWCPRLYIV